MNISNNERHIRNEVIIGFRAIIEARYQFDSLQANYDLPPSFDQKRVNQFRDYFLNYIYPPPEKRAKLDDAFESLEGYTKNPEKLLRLLLDSARLVFKYGRHLPKILQAGIKALRSFLSASAFENKLVRLAIASDIEAPFDQTEIESLIAQLSPDEIEKFIQSSHALFDTLHDRVLVEKIEDIVDDLIKKMKDRPTVYGPEEIQGLEIGRDIIHIGNGLFDELSKEDQHQLIAFVIEIEREYLEEIFKRNS